VARARVRAVLTRLRRWLRRPADERQQGAPDPTISRAGQAVAGMRPGDQRHRPTQAERDLAAKVGVTVHDSTDRRM
jgi:hypothetical protein